MKVNFYEFFEDLGVNKGLALRHPAWLSVVRYIVKDIFV